MICGRATNRLRSGAGGAGHHGKARPWEFWTPTFCPGFALCLQSNLTLFLTLMPGASVSPPVTWDGGGQVDLLSRKVLQKRTLR